MLRIKGKASAFLCVSLFSLLLFVGCYQHLYEDLELIIYMFLDQGFELMKNSKIRYLKLLSVNTEVKIFRRRTSEYLSFAELRCWNLNSSWAWGFCRTLNGFGTSDHSPIDLLSPENKFETAFDRQMLL